MNKKIKIIDQDIVFLSYDEPNAEENYVDLLNKVPWAKRVHGVKGSDAAHKACAAISDTEYFTTVDADNIIEPDYLNVEIDFDELGLDESYVFSWCGRIHVNGLEYGNGGLKLWTREFVNNMKTHENALPHDERNKVEFCFDQRYYQFNERYSESFTNSTPFQAWRAGFREGVKMGLDQGFKVDDLRKVWRQNYRRLLIWCTIGADVKNGLWSVYGARQGLHMAYCTDWDYANVRDFEYLKTLFDETKPNTDSDLNNEIVRLGDIIRSSLRLEIADLDANGSKFFKSTVTHIPRRLKGGAD